MKSYSEWTNREHETMLRMKQEGFKVREIAEPATEAPAL